VRKTLAIIGAAYWHLLDIRSASQSRWTRIGQAVFGNLILPAANPMARTGMFQPGKTIWKHRLSFLGFRLIALCVSTSSDGRNVGQIVQNGKSLAQTTIKI